MFTVTNAASHRRGEERRRQRGAVAVEFALAAPLLAMLLLGTVTAGFSYSKSIGLANAVREGARFGASADASSATWAADVITRVRETQFDDHGTPETAICVQLYKQSATPPGTVIASSCDTAGGPPLSIADEDAIPTVTDEIPADTCVVRVVAARKFEINAVMVPLFTGTAVRGSIARYEKDC